MTHRTLPQAAITARVKHRYTAPGDTERRYCPGRHRNKILHSTSPTSIILDTLASTIFRDVKTKSTSTYFTPGSHYSSGQDCEGLRYLMPFPTKHHLVIHVKRRESYSPGGAAIRSKKQSVNQIRNAASEVHFILFYLSLPFFFRSLCIFVPRMPQTTHVYALRMPRAVS